MMVASIRFSSSLLLAASLFAVFTMAQAGSFSGIVSHVTDGDSIWVRPAYGAAPVEVRIQGIDAPEICQPFGVESRRALAAHILQQQVGVATRARDSYRRVVARVSLRGDDVGGWMVAHGYAWSYRFHRHNGPYAAQEAQARAGRLGLWSSSQAVEPRLFRQRHGRCR